MEPSSDYTLFHEVSDFCTDGKKTISGENIALKTILSDKRNNDVTSVTPDIEEMAKNSAYSSFVKNNKREKLCMSLLLFCATLLIIGIMQIPITLYYTDPASAAIEVSSIADFESCEVIYTYICTYCICIKLYFVIVCVYVYSTVCMNFKGLLQ